MHDRSDGDKDDEDSAEAQAHRSNQQDFQMDEILGGHEQRLVSRAPYRISTHLLQSGAATPSRGQDFDADYEIGSRAPTPVTVWNPPPQMGSHATTPAFVPPSRDALEPPPSFLPDWRSPAASVPRADTSSHFPPLHLCQVSFKIWNSN